MSTNDVKTQHAIIGNQEADPNGYVCNTHPDTKWWNETCFGLFIHWGISAVSGMTDLSWGMMKPRPHEFENSEPMWGLAAHGGSLTPRQYWEDAKGFTAENYNPDEWLKAAKEAGFQYVIITTKHHDGYCLWPSEYGDLSTKNYLNGRDLIGEFIESARKHNLRIGLYYSPPDWRFCQDYMSYARDEEIGIDFEPRKKKTPTPEFQQKLKEYRHGQIVELLTRYGQIDMFWFDGSCEMAITPEEIRALQPGILCNDRGWGYGDFTCPECKFPAKRYADGVKFQYIHCLSDGGWGYRDYDIYRPMGWMVGEMGKARSWGGHFVANVGPKADGTLPQIYYYRMKQIKEWMDKYSSIMFDVEGGPWPEKCNVPVTTKDGVWFVHADWRVDYPIEITDVEKPSSVKMFDGTDVPYQYENRKITFMVPWGKKHHYTDPVRIEWK